MNLIYIPAKENAQLSHIIYGLSIPHVGRAKADELALKFSSLDQLKKVTQECLQQLEGIDSV